MTLGMTLALLGFFVWAVIRIFQWTFRDPPDHHGPKGPWKG